jgi:hypothetical protein
MLFRWKIIQVQKLKSRAYSLRGEQFQQYFTSTASFQMYTLQGFHYQLIYSFDRFLMSYDVNQFFEVSLL